VTGRTGGLICCFVLCRAFSARQIACTFTAMRYLAYIINSYSDALCACFNTARESTEIASNGCSEKGILLDKLSHAHHAFRFQSHHF
jgi:hypothetical protein